MNPRLHTGMPTILNDMAYMPLAAIGSLIDLARKSVCLIWEQDWELLLFHLQKMASIRLQPIYSQCRENISIIYPIILRLFHVWYTYSKKRDQNQSQATMIP